MIFTANFNPTIDPKLLCTCGHIDCDKRSVNQFTLDGVQKVREDYGRPMTITRSGAPGGVPKARSNRNCARL